MGAFDRIATNLGRRDEEPNKELAAELAAQSDDAGIAEIVAHLGDRNQSIAGDCIGVLYHIGYLMPALIASYLNTFVALLKSPQNRMIWGAMIAIWTITPVRPSAVFRSTAPILAAMEAGTVITRISGIKILGALCACHDGARRVMAPIVLESIRNSRAVDLATTIETAAPGLAVSHAAEFLEVIGQRLPHASRGQQKRIRAALNGAGLVEG